MCTTEFVKIVQLVQNFKCGTYIIYIHTHTYIYTRTYIRTYIHKYIHTYIQGGAETIRRLIT
jgi:hypothetical protein